MIMKKLLILFFAATPLVAFADGKLTNLYVISPTYYGSALFKTALSADIYVNNGVDNYQSSLKPGYYSKVSLTVGEIAIINGHKFKVEDKNYYFRFFSV